MENNKKEDEKISIDMSMVVAVIALVTAICAYVTASSESESLQIRLNIYKEKKDIKEMVFPCLFPDKDGIKEAYCAIIGLQKNDE